MSTRGSRRRRRTATAELSSATYAAPTSSCSMTGESKAVAVRTIDHIAIGPGHHRDRHQEQPRPSRASHRRCHQRRELLLVNGRDRTSQLDALERQVERVEAVLDRHGADCFGVLGGSASRSCDAASCTTATRATALITVDDPAHIAKLANGL